MSFKTPMLCDRRVYDKKGKWKNPNEDTFTPFYYYIKTPRTLEQTYNNGREEFIETITIVIFGEHPIVADDDIYLETGEHFKVSGYTLNYFEPNILIKDMLKPRVESMEVVLQ